MFSRSTLEIHSPPDLITSLARSEIWMKPFGSIDPTSPVRSQPSWNFLVGRIEVVAAGDPGAADLDLALGLAVPRRGPAPSSPQIRISTPGIGRPVRTRQLMASAGRCPRGTWAMAASGLVSVMPQAWTTGHPERLVEPFDEAAGDGRTAADHLPKRAEVGVGPVVHDVVEHGGHRTGVGRSGRLDDLGQMRRLQELLGHHQIGSNGPAGVRHAPGVGVEHRDDQQQRSSWEKPMA